MLADTPLVKNLSNLHYMQILLGDRPNLQALFADLDVTAASNDFEPSAETGRILPGFIALIKMADLPIRISEVAAQPQFMLDGMQNVVRGLGEHR